MRALRLHNASLRFEEAQPQPEIGKDEALVRVSLAGICSTDLELIKGYFGFEGILGHEFVGTVVSPEDSKWIGKRVVSSINFADVNTPEFEEFGLEHHPHRSVLGILNRDGAMADYVAVPLANLYEVPETIPERIAVFTEPLAAALRIKQQLEPLGRFRKNLQVTVLGPGRLGMLIAKVLSLQGLSVTVVGRRTESLELARSWNLSVATPREVADSSMDLVVEATGNPEGLRQAIRMTRPLGTLVLKSTFEGLSNIDLTKIVVDEIHLLGSRCGPFDKALKLLAERSIEVEDLVDAEYPANEGAEAFRYAAQPGVRKVLLNFSD